ncbi:MAG: branched-chain amino acid ABC transporter permease [Sneathiellaceae bacterium]
MTEEDWYWTFIDIANGLLSGTMLGGYYAVISIGLALTFGVMRLVNLAHGDFLIFAAYVATVMLSLVPISPFYTLILVVPVMFAVGYGLQRFLLNRVSVQAMEQKGMSSNFGLMSPILVTFGTSIVVSHALLGIFSSDTTSIRNSLSYSAIRLSQDLSISSLRLIFFCLAVAILLFVHLFLSYTHTGRAIRAASDDAEVAPLMGIVTDRVYAIATGISLAIAGVAGVMIGMSRPFQPFDGPQFLLIAFGVVIIGGLGSIMGALVGGVLLGIVQILAGTYFGPSAQLVAGYMLILLVLAVRPQGLFAR